MFRLLCLFIIGACFFSASFVYNADSKKMVQEKFDGVSKATKPKRTSKLHS
jgi:hypothetical protein